MSHAIIEKIGTTTIGHCGARNQKYLKQKNELNINQNEKENNPKKKLKKDAKPEETDSPKLSGYEDFEEKE